ncbi:nucleotidyltransferase domain-containing protein [Fulvivirga maritima]|uniref:nucleotidyltransferase domain-containing protein n=1 Tax=Fulvivirga maritima TaxID=2904247 RepID=UPI001F4850CE|nr:nucleotidyltransferase domain-containing protein [Fulvivirga maritima]UII25201.1 nucleotidyltransferase domain-containing protein [Fulvivirga maritima]
MKKVIQKQLEQIEESDALKILFACETGSRAWGFPSPDSDYDVRCIYVKSMDWHLSLTNKKDSFEKFINQELDITGWEVGKVLKLMWKSNVSVLERLQSPVIYKLQDIDLLSELWRLAQSCFSPVSTMYHYHNMASRYIDACFQSDEEVKLKSYFYAIRATICANWVREMNAIPPIEMNKMFEILSPELKHKIEELIDLKSGKSEGYFHPKDALIDEFLLLSTRKNEEVAPTLPGAVNRNMEELEDFYRKIVRSNDCS